MAETFEGKFENIEGTAYIGESTFVEYKLEIGEKLFYYSGDVEKLSFMLTKNVKVEYEKRKTSFIENIIRMAIFHKPLPPHYNLVKRIELH